MRWSNLPFKLESEIVRWWYRTTGGRPASGRYITGDGFRALTPWRYEPGTPFDPSRVPEGALVYCDGWKLGEFLVGPALAIPGRFSVVAHNADPNITASTVTLFPPRLVRLYSNNVLVDDPRVVPLPLGLENARLHYHGVVADFDRLRKGPAPSRNRVLVSFTERNNPTVRGPALDQLRRSGLADFPPPLNSRAYRKLAVGYRFVASPPGNGEDCHRTWEALALRSVPIVLRSFLSEHFASLGLPLWVVDRYSDLVGLTEEDLDAKYRELAPRFDHPAASMAYWTSLVLGKGSL